MDLTRRAPQLGIVACLAVIVAAILPYVLLPEDASAGLGLYYNAGAFGPTIVAVFAAVNVVVLGAGLGQRSDPVTVAGAALVIGLFMTLMSIEWLVSLPDDAIAGIAAVPDDPDATIRVPLWLEYHRWAILACSVLVALSAALYARALDVL
jgi:hypothetical protein